MATIVEELEQTIQGIAASVGPAVVRIGRGWGRGLHGLNKRSASLMRREKQLGKGIGPREATPTRKMRSNGS